MSFRSWPRTDKGYVLIIVMGLLGALFTMALSLGAIGRASLAQARRFQDQTAAEFLARAGIEWGLSYLQDAERQDRLWQSPWYRHPEDFLPQSLGAGRFDLTYRDATGTRHYGLQDEESRLNVLTAPARMLALLPGVGPERAETIVAQRQQQVWRTPAELVRRGLVSAAVFDGTASQPGLAAYLTVWGNGKINLNTAPAAVLAAVPGLSPALAEAIVHYRQGPDQVAWSADDRPLHQVADLARLPEVDGTTLTRAEPWLTTVSQTFRVVATGYISRGHDIVPDLVHHRLAIIDRTTQPVRLHAWRWVE